MNLIWNEFLLKQPPLLTLPVRHLKFNIHNLRKLLDDFIVSYESQREFEECAALCSRIIARRKNSFRKMEGFKSLCKLNSALCRLLKLDIKEVLNNFLGILPEYSMSSDFTTELPSCSNLDYVLIRLIGLHKLFVRIFNCCKQVARYFSKLLSKCFFMDITTLILAITSTIWKVSFKISSKTSKFYGKLIEYRSHFPQSKTPWITHDFEFPKELEEISDKNPFDAYSQEKQFSEADNVLAIHKREQGAEHIEKKIKIVGLPNNLQQKDKKVSLDIDVGVEINRESLTPQFDLNKFSNVDEIRHFLQQEEKRRQECLHNCVTKAISNEKWVLLKKRIKNKINSNDYRTAVKSFKAAFKDKI